ncbi:hypothetical protein Q7P37_009027 [Cladosporium fusiforme]
MPNARSRPCQARSELLACEVKVGNTQHGAPTSYFGWLLFHTHTTLQTETTPFQTTNLVILFVHQLVHYLNRKQLGTRHARHVRNTHQQQRLLTIERCHTTPFRPHSTSLYFELRRQRPRLFTTTRAKTIFSPFQHHITSNIQPTINMDSDHTMSRIVSDGIVEDATMEIEQESSQKSNDVPFKPNPNKAGSIEVTTPRSKRATIATTPPAKKVATPLAPRKRKRGNSDIITKTELNRTRSPLISLPGELRNRIYRYTLVRARSIEIDASTWSTHQPSLLATCRQIRAEALPIFYVENRISAEIRDWDPVVKQRLFDLSLSHKLEMSSRMHHFHGVPNWTNLYAWLRGVFDGRLSGISDCVGKQRPMERKTIGVMFMIVRRARARGLLWEDVSEILEAQAELLGVLNPAWKA